MRTATTVEASSFESWPSQRDFIVEAERLGLDICWVAEAWGSDAHRRSAITRRAPIGCCWARESCSSGHARLSQ
jgi:alkanesulfonate monooxygenase SsuD/methylene tetrahydromethanopterin reductase-like flavin-dependent oxidoreductase (luciferase family)